MVIFPTNNEVFMQIRWKTAVYSHVSDSEGDSDNEFDL